MRAILFDLDGTLVDSSEGITKCAQYALAHYGIEETAPEKLYAFIGPPLQYTFEKLYGFSEERADEAVVFYRERYNRDGIFECSLYPHVAECVQELRAQGYRVGVASSKPELSCRRILEHFGVLELFDDVAGATFDRRISTKEEVLREVLRRWADIPREEMCLVGDTIFDVEGAKCIGMPCVAVRFGFGDMEEMMAAGAVAVCDDLLELPGILAKIS
ncbi:MAG: HAD hydrolase-like protein [Blautia sp.]|nr:HAD hydrolase-like protein [Blautia sp.]